jgi:hypothetical protein
VTPRLYPRSWTELDTRAGEVLTRHARETGWTASLPVPIEDIVERTFGLHILWEPLEEGPGERVLAMLTPSERTVRMNELHLDGIFASQGPINYSLAHELGHWLFDAVPPEQGALFDAAGAPVFCRGGKDSADLREGNAERFAAALLLPRGLVPTGQLHLLSHDELREQALVYGVSLRALKIRLDQLSASSLPGQRPLS